jgi:6-phosphofructokinase 1
MVVEVMGRYAGWIALMSGAAGGGDILLIPEIPFRLSSVFEAVKQRGRVGKRFSIIVVAEGAHEAGGDLIVSKRIENSPDPVRLGGIGQWLADKIEENTGIESRAIVLGHVQRGGSPTPYDRILSTRYGAHAARLARERNYGRMVAVKGEEITSVPLSVAVGKTRKVPVEHELILALKDIGISFGE